MCPAYALKQNRDNKVAGKTWRPIHLDRSSAPLTAAKAKASASYIRVRELSRSRVILRNVASNWLGFVIQAIVLFFLTPFVLRELGDVRYGVWVLIATTTGYYGLIGFGLTGGVTQYITRHLATKDYGMMNETASTAAAILSCIGALVLLTSIVLASLAPVIFNIPDEYREDVFWCVIIIGGTIAVQFSLFLYSAVLVATERYDLSNFTGVAGTLLDALFVFVALKGGHGLVGICIAKSASDVIGIAMRVVLAYRVLPELTVRFRLFNRRTVRTLMSYGTWSFVIVIAQSIVMQVDALVIGTVMPVVAVAHYALAASIALHVYRILRPIDRVFLPTLTHLHAKDDIQGLRSVYFRGSRIHLLVVTIVSVIAICWANDFFRLWIGAEYLSGAEYPSVAFLFSLLALANVGRLLPSLGGQVLQAAMLVRPLALIALSEAVVNVGLTIIFVQYWGLVGVAVATLVAVFTLRAFLIPYVVSRYIDMPITAYFRDSLLRPAVVAILFYPCALAIRKMFVTSRFELLILQGVLASIAGAVLAVALGLSSSERRHYVHPIGRRIKSSLSFRRKNRSLPPT
jgi:O-antigen/teichoic acid export membrane protein